MSEFVNRVVVFAVGAAVVSAIDVSHACREDNTTCISRVCQSDTPTFGG